MIRPDARFAPAALAALVLFIALPAAACEEASQPVRLEHANADYEAGRYGQAFTAFSKLADQDDAEAARIAVLMARHGSSLYGEDFTLAASRITQWTARIENRRVAEVRPAD